jgi:N-acetylglutamate synthase/N-acetylornithine aminotransferase
MNTHARTKTFFNKTTVNPETQHTPKMEKGSGMLEPILQNIHIPLQPPKKVSLKLPRLLVRKEINICFDTL